MSIKHPVIAITGSSGAGTSTVKNAFNHIFSRVGATPVIIEGDSFHIAALNLAHDLIRSENTAQKHTEASGVLSSMNSKLNSVLSDLTN